MIFTEGVLLKLAYLNKFDMKQQRRISKSLLKFKVICAYPSCQP
jgi:hypothetical protein